jgi:hypothetical protein
MVSYPGMTMSWLKRAKKSDYTIDLRVINGDGAFPCPKCGVIISPDDETEEIYRIIETRVEKGDLKELTLICQKCKSKIKIIGFQ